ncbi:MAG TPA: ADOP family duplicated permease [Longimicrobiales bacterium]|nr:ADOP family duplicated permease [Longimicrobiales bacterium]
MLLTDIRHAVRALNRRPGFTAIAVLTLALGIGATSAIFSALYHTLLRPLPFEGGERMVYGWMSGGGMMISPSLAQVDAWRARARSFDLIAQYDAGEYTLRGEGDASIVAGAAIERALPAALRVAPVLGRVFTAEEMQPQGRLVVMLSEGLWQRRFGGRADVLGERIEVNDERYEIVGVLPNRFAAFQGETREGQLWFPLRLGEGQSTRASALLRLREGVDTAAASAELRTISRDVTEDHQLHGEWTPQLMPATAFLDGATQKGLPLLFAAVSAVLLIACANLAGLLLVRVAGRRREVAIRAAIGASRGAITRLVAAESLLLAIGGGAAGALLAGWLMDLARLVRPDSLNTLDQLSVDGVTLASAAALTLLTALLFGAAPAWSAVRHDLIAPLMAGGAGARVTAGGRLRAVLVAGQIAASLVLLVASLLLVRSVGYLQRQDVGFRPAGVQALRLELPGTSYPDAAARRAFFDQLLPALRQLPAVRSVATATGVPTQFGAMLGEVQIEGRALDTADRERFLNFAAVSSDYARTMGLQVVAGRFLQESDRDAIIIDAAWAARLWPGESAIGRRIRLSAAPDAPWLSVVGVVRGVMGRKGGTDAPQVYVPAEYTWGHGWVVLRTDPDAASIAPLVRAAVGRIDARLVPRDFTTMETLLSDTIALDRFYMLLLVSFALTALLLSVIGLYGVISNAVTQRIPEIGVRLALGASPRGVQRLVLGQGLRLTAIGLGIGVAATLFLVKLLSSVIYGVQPYDAVSFAGAAAVLMTAACLAVWLPTRRALRVDPVAALRSE